MVQIPLREIHANPYRDFDLHPIDQVQVERLKASINADGFWSSVTARKAADGYEVAYGHHRIEAAKSLGLDTVPIEVRELDDWQMVRMLASENATQRGSTSAACLDAVAAISRVLAYSLLRWDEATFAKNLAKVGIDYASCRGRLEAGSGIGHDCIRSFATKDAFSDAQVQAALGTLKDSGRMASIIAAASAKAGSELQAEQEAAERALAAAKEREAVAATDGERVAATKATKAATREVGNRKKSTESTAKAAAAIERNPIVYDARCAQLFKIDSHAATFRQIVTGETFQAYLPLDRQFEFAQDVLAKIKENQPNKKEVTATDIRGECWARIESSIGLLKGKLRTAPERPYQHEIIDGLNMLRRGFGDYRRGIALVSSALRKGETLDPKQRLKLDKLLADFEAGLAIRDEMPKANNLKIVGS